MALYLQIENNAICRHILKTISKLRNQISLRFQLTSMHSKFVGHSNEIIWQSKIKGPLLTETAHTCRGGLVALLLLFILAFEPPKFREFILLLNS